MATADEIRQRVLAAEKDRIDRRAAAVEAVAEADEEVAAIQVDLAAAERRRAELVRKAERDMQRGELAGFLGRKQSEVTEWIDTAPKRRRRAKTQKPAITNAVGAGASGDHEESTSRTL